MNTVSIKDDNGKEYVFENNGDNVNLLKIVKDKHGESRIIGYYISESGFTKGMSWDTRGRPTWSREKDDLVIVPYCVKAETVMSIKELEEKFGIKNLKIKGE